MTLEDQMKLEFERVQGMLAEQLGNLEHDGGNIRFFAAAYLTLAVRLYAEIEGTEGLARSITRLGREEMQARGAGTC